jgi:hypothetical protein
VTECQGCGAWNNTSRTLCVLCGTPLAETDEWDAAAELPPLPPLPDGGLRSSMPTWLRDPPQLPVAESLPPTRAALTRIEDPPLGSHVDPRTFLSDDDFPRWLRDLAARREEALSPSTEANGAPPTAKATIPRAAPPAWPDLPEPVGPTRTPANTDTFPLIAVPVGAQRLAEPSSGPEPTSTPEPDPEPDGRLPAAVVTRTSRHDRGRGVWEALLLVFLFIGIIVAALWALVSNGVFSPGL